MTAGRVCVRPRWRCSWPAARSVRTTAAAGPGAAAFKELAGWKPATPMRRDRSRRLVVGLRRSRAGPARGQADISNQTHRAGGSRLPPGRGRRWREPPVPRSGATPGVDTNGSGARAAAAAASHVANSRLAGATRSISGGGGGSHHPHQLSRSRARVDWDLDLWGRIRRQVESNAAAAAGRAPPTSPTPASRRRSPSPPTISSCAAPTRCSGCSTQTVAAFERSLADRPEPVRVGIAARSDVITRASPAEGDAGAGDQCRRRPGANSSMRSRVLIGHPPAELTLARGDAAVQGSRAAAEASPRRLLERRPDIAAAERTWPSRTR